MAVCLHPEQIACPAAQEPAQVNCSTQLNCSTRLNKLNSTKSTNCFAVAQAGTHCKANFDKTGLTLTKGASANLASRLAISVLPQPVGPIIRMFLGTISSWHRMKNCPLMHTHAQCMQQRQHFTETEAQPNNYGPDRLHHKCITDGTAGTRAQE